MKQGDNERIIEREVKDETSTLGVIEFSHEEANQYLEDHQKFGQKIGLGVAILILSPILVLLLGTYHEQFLEGTNDRFVLLGVIALLVMVMIAIAMFILNAMGYSHLEVAEKNLISLDKPTREAIEKEQTAYKMPFAKKLVSATILIFVGIIMIILFGVLFPEESFYQGISVAAFLLLIAIAVYLFITAGMRHSAYLKLLNEGEYSRAGITKSKKSNALASVYWLFVVAGYLAWSFLANAWHISWIVFPIAGVLYAAINTLVTHE